MNPTIPHLLDIKSCVCVYRYLRLFKRDGIKSKIGSLVSGCVEDERRPTPRRSAPHKSRCNLLNLDETS